MSSTRDRLWHPPAAGQHRASVRIAVDLPVTSPVLDPAAGGRPAARLGKPGESSSSESPARNRTSATAVAPPPSHPSGYGAAAADDDEIGYTRNSFAGVHGHPTGTASGSLAAAPGGRTPGARRRHLATPAPTPAPEPSFHSTSAASAQSSSAASQSSSSASQSSPLPSQSPSQSGAVTPSGQRGDDPVGTAPSDSRAAIAGRLVARDPAVVFSHPASPFTRPLVDGTWVPSQSPPLRQQPRCVFTIPLCGFFFFFFFFLYIGARMFF
jgi:hypothetical protein